MRFHVDGEEDVKVKATAQRREKVQLIKDVVQTALLRVISASHLLNCRTTAPRIGRCAIERSSDVLAKLENESLGLHTVKGHVRRTGRAVGNAGQLYSWS